MVAGGEKKWRGSDRIVQDGIRGLSSVPLQTYFQLADGRYTRGHRWKLVKAHMRCKTLLLCPCVESLEQSATLQAYSRRQSFKRL